MYVCMYACMHVCMTHLCMTRVCMYDSCHRSETARRPVAGSLGQSFKNRRPLSDHRTMVVLLKNLSATHDRLTIAYDQQRSPTITHDHPRLVVRPVADCLQFSTKARTYLYVIYNIIAWKDKLSPHTYS